MAREERGRKLPYLGSWEGLPAPRTLWKMHKEQRELWAPQWGGNGEDGEGTVALCGLYSPVGLRDTACLGRAPGHNG